MLCLFCVCVTRGVHVWSDLGRYSSTEETYGGPQMGAW